MEMQVSNLDQVFNAEDISVVVGFKKNLIMERFPDLTFVYNPFFDQTNTSKSLLKALKKNRNTSVLWLNGDVVFDVKVLSLLEPYISKDQSFVAVNTDKVGEEEVKYTLNDKYIDLLSKTVENGLGEAVGINYISKNDIKQFIQALEQCDDNDYFERGLEIAIANDGLEIEAVDISKYDCMEVDFQEDLDNANNLFTK